MAHNDHDHDQPGDEEPVRFWEQRYADRPQVWSGRVNQVLADVVSGFTPGRALDLGCGEGGDTLWLAQQGWRVTGVDIAVTAVERARSAAAEAGVADAVDLVATDLATWVPEGSYDLVIAFFLQSPVELDRNRILRTAAGSVAPGGHLLLVSHAAPPPWASALAGHHRVFLTPEQELATLAPFTGGWETLIAEVRTRAVTDPDGRPAVLDDTVVLLRRN